MTGPALRDIHVPSAAWWPLAPGWWIVAGLALLLGMFVAWLLWRHANGRVTRAALREVDRMQAAFDRDRDLATLVAGASRLLRRIALRVEPAAASFRGEAWRAFLRDRACDAREATVLDQLVDAPFQAHPEIDAAELLQALRGWCKHAVRTSRTGRKRKARALRHGLRHAGQANDETSRGGAAGIP
jgi:hypothetical protein